MAATGFTPIQLYRTSTTGTSPTAGNLTAGELAINYNTADMSVWALNTGGSVIRLMNNPAGLKYPTTDGTANQVMVTNGSGVLSWAAGPSGTYLPLAGGTMTGAITFAAGQFGTNVNTFLSTPSSANLAAALTDETGSGAAVFATSPTLVTPVLGTPTSGTLSSCTVDGTDAVGFRNIPINSQSAAYTAVLADSGKCIFHPSTDANARTFTIPANGSVAYPIGTAISFVNMTSQVVSIAITTDTMYLAGTGTTGTRSLAQYGTATALKIESNKWIISGAGLT
jgi:hypothetical protein